MPQHKNIQFIEDFVATRITGGSQGVSGVVGLDMRLANPSQFKLAPLLLATAAILNYGAGRIRSQV